MALHTEKISIHGKSKVEAMNITNGILKKHMLDQTADENTWVYTSDLGQVSMSISYNITEEYMTLEIYDSEIIEYETQKIIAEIKEEI